MISNLPSVGSSPAGLTIAAVDIQRPSIVSRCGLVRRSVRRAGCGATLNATELWALGLNLRCKHSVNVPERFQTERLILRRVRPSDAPDIFERWAQDSEVIRYLSWTPHRRVEDTEAFVSFCQTQWEHQREFVWVLEELHSGELLGSMSARVGEHGINVGYLLARQAWGRGLMPEAVRRLSEWGFDKLTG